MGWFIDCYKGKSPVTRNLSNFCRTHKLAPPPSWTPQNRRTHLLQLSCYVENRKDCKRHVCQEPHTRFPRRKLNGSLYLMQTTGLLCPHTCLAAFGRFSMISHRLETNQPKAVQKSSALFCRWAYALTYVIKRSALSLTKYGETLKYILQKPPITIKQLEGQ